jgi:hypothetical protein
MKATLSAMKVAFVALQEEFLRREFKKMRKRIDYSMPPCRVTFSLPTRSKKMIDELADVTYGSVQRFGRVVFMEGLRKLYPDCFEALIAMECNEEQKFFSDLNVSLVVEELQSELSSLRSEVAELRAAITMRAPANEESAS